MRKRSESHPPGRSTDRIYIVSRASTARRLIRNGCCARGQSSARCS